MPGLQSANLSAKLLRELGGGAVIGPMLVGMEHPVQVATMASTGVRPGHARGARGGRDRAVV
jgi:phosphotransacetylase